MGAGAVVARALVLRTEKKAQARVSEGEHGTPSSHTDPALPRGEHTRGWTNLSPPSHPAPTPRIALVCASPHGPHRPTSPPTTQGPLEAWCFPRPAAAGHSATRHSVRVPFQAHRCSSPIVAWLELMLDIAQIRKQCTTVLSRNTGHVGST